MISDFEQKIQFQQKRDFGDLITATFTFAKQEFPNYKAPLLKYFLPLIMLFSVLGHIFLYDLTSSVASSDIFNFEKLGSPLFAFLIIGVITFVYNLYVFGYIRDYIDSNGIVDTTRIKQISNARFLPALGMTILAGLLSILGFFLLIIPGIFLAVVFYMVLPIIFFDANGMNALSKSAKLMKNQWWFSFGLYIVFGLILQILSLLISIPEYFFTPLSLSYYIASGVLTSFSIILSGLSPILVSFHYFNLKERNEMSSLIDRVENI